MEFGTTSGSLLDSVHCVTFQVGIWNLLLLFALGLACEKQKHWHWAVHVAVRMHNTNHIQHAVCVVWSLDGDRQSSASSRPRNINMSDAGDGPYRMSSAGHKDDGQILFCISRYVCFIPAIPYVIGSDHWSQGLTLIDLEDRKTLPLSLVLNPCCLGSGHCLLFSVNGLCIASVSANHSILMNTGLLLWLFNPHLYSSICFTMLCVSLAAPHPIHPMGYFVLNAPWGIVYSGSTWPITYLPGYS